MEDECYAEDECYEEEECHTEEEYHAEEECHAEEERKAEEEKNDHWTKAHRELPECPTGTFKQVKLIAVCR